MCLCGEKSTQYCLAECEKRVQDVLLTLKNAHRVKIPSFTALEFQNTARSFSSAGAWRNSTCSLQPSILQLEFRIWNFRDLIALKTEVMEKCWFYGMNHIYYCSYFVLIH